jgi:uncharacterized lipoprotein YmbA
MNASMKPRLLGAGRVAAVLTGLLAACASPSPAPVLLTLPSALASSSAAPPPSAGAAATPAPVLALRRIGLPEYLIARRVRYRADAATLAEWPNTYWAERVEIGVSREFTAAVRQQLPGWSVCDTNCGDLAPALTLQVDLVPMDYQRPTQRLQAQARLSLTRGGAGTQVVQARQTAYQIPATADTAQAHAAAISALIGQVAAEAAGLVNAAGR